MFWTIKLTSSLGVVLIYYLNMSYLTINKLLEIILNIRYPIFINEVRIKILLKCTWLFGLTFSTCMVLVRHFIPHFQFGLLTLYYYPTLDFCFLSAAIITYGFIFHKFYLSREALPSGRRLKSSRASSSSITRRASVWNVFRASKFYVSVLLISSFLIFTVIPDLTLMLHALLGRSIPQVMYAVCYILYTLSFFADAVIYIAMQRRVRRRVWKLLRCVVPCATVQRLLSDKMESESINDTWLWKYLLLKCIVGSFFILRGYHTVPYRTVPYHTIPCRTQPYCTLPYPTILCRAVPCLTAPRLTVPYCAVPYRAVLYCTVLYPTLPYSTAPYHTVSYRTIP